MAATEEQEPVWHAVFGSPLSLLLVLFTGSGFMAVVGLFGFHVWLVTVGMTTHEHLRGTLVIRNPYDTGSPVRNWFLKMCRPFSPSFAKHGPVIASSRVTWV